jgi:hypothetical protein
MRRPRDRGVTRIVPGSTSADYLGLSVNPFAWDAGREWLLMRQAALWSKLTDGGQVDGG